MLAMDPKQTGGAKERNAPSPDPISDELLEDLGDKLLSICGGGKTLVAGCGTGRFVRTLLARGVDAFGQDSAEESIRDAEEGMPDRFRASTFQKLPYADQSFDTVVCIRSLETLPRVGVRDVLREIRRVTRRYVFVLTKARNEDKGGRNGSIVGREAWERHFLDNGFRKHPLLQKIVSDEELEAPGDAEILAFERIGDAEQERFPGASIAAELDPRIDMLRETGRRSEAACSRYQLAAQFVRPGDTVLDVGCGLGYGATILASGSRAARVIGADGSSFAIEYARANYGPLYPRIVYMQAEAAELPSLPDHSVDVAVVFEMLERSPDPAAALAELRRVLRPAGRLVVSVPNGWAGAAEKDPSRHESSSYNWARILAEVGEGFILEKAYAQTAGGGVKFPTEPRAVREVRLHDHDPGVAEWWIVVGMKNPAGYTKSGYVEVNLPTYPDAPESHITAFERDYDNPWLVRGMVSIGLRMTNSEGLEAIASEVVKTARRGSADMGAALCVLGYRFLERRDLTGAEISDLLEKIREYQTEADDVPHAWRWRISTQFVAGRLLLSQGRLPEAREAFLECATLDCLKFSPLLATKTADALFRAGLLAACERNEDEARECWQRGLREIERVLKGDWLNIVGRADDPAPFGLPEVAELADLGSVCAYGLRALDRWEDQPGASWTYANGSRARELAGWRKTALARARWIKELDKARRWQTDQAANWSRLAKERESVIFELEKTKYWLNAERENWEQTAKERASFIEELEKGRAWLDEQRATWERLAKERGARVEELEKGRSWQEQQRGNWERTATDRATYILELEKGRAWLEEQREGWEKTAKERAGYIEELERGRAWLEEQRASWERTATERVAYIEELERARAWLEEQRGSWEQTAAERAKYVAELEQGQAWLEEQRVNWEKIAQEREDRLGQAEDARKHLEKTLDEQRAATLEKDQTLGSLRLSLQESEKERESLRGEVEALVKYRWLPAAVSRWLRKR